MIHSIARFLSIFGHPAVLMAVAAAVVSSGADVLPAVALTIVFGLVVLSYSYYKTKKGDWSHIDASTTRERSQLNTRVGIGLVAAAGILTLANIHIGISVVVALSGLIFLAGYLLQGTAKLSLHVAFAMFAALIAWPQPVLTACLLLVALAVGWSRIVLQRHVARDLVWGSVVGTLAGLVFQVVRTSIDD